MEVPDTSGGSRVRRTVLVILDLAFPPRRRFPVGVAGGLSVYSYANGHPLATIDPSGTYPWGVRLVHLGRS